MPRDKKYIKLVAIIVVLLITCAVTAIIIINKYQSTSNSFLPESIRKQIQFKVFVPTDSTFRIDQNSYDFQNNVLTFVVKDAHNEPYFVSQQKLPPGIDLTTFQSKLKEKEVINTHLGQAYIGISENTKIGSVINEDTWLFASTSIKTSSPSLKSLLQNLK